MLTNLTKQTALLSISPRANRSLVAGMLGRSLCVYCVGSIPANLPFDGSVRLGHTATETTAISDSRQLQL